MRQLRSGFSLIELLVVVAIVAVLLAIAVPSLGNARDAARDAKCRVHLKGIFGAQFAYERDYHRFAAMWTSADKTSWRVKLLKYVSGSDGGDAPQDAVQYEMFMCPSVDSDEYAQQPTDAANGQFPASIGLNGAMQFAPWNYRSAAPPRPAEIIALGDQPVDIFEFMLTAEGYGVWTNGTQTNWWKAPNHQPARGYRHNKHQSCNMAFMDGHVDQLQTAALMRESGRWFWWDAIRGDTANDSGGSGGSPTGTMPQTPTPNPSPNTPSGGGPITGPLTAPCGCPPPCKPASTPPPPALPLQFRHTG